MPWKRVRNSRKRLKSAQPQDVFCSTKLKILNKTILARWPAARPRCIPPAGGSFRALNPLQSQQTVSPVKHSRETSLSLHPSIKGLSRPLKPLAPCGRCITNQGSVPATPNTPMTISWRPGREHSCYPSLEPSHRPKSLRAPWNPDQPYADWMPPSLRR